jgi:hypothetical protein
MFKYWRPKNWRAKWLWPVAFALIQFAQACVCVLCLGQWNPNWLLEFVRWRTLKEIGRQNDLFL